MQKQETLAQLIRRTVFEFEQRQAACEAIALTDNSVCQTQLQQESHIEAITKASQPQIIDKPKGRNRKKKTV